MKTALVIAAVLVVAAPGCKRPGPVELRTDTASPTVEVTNVVVDTSTTITSTDSTALLPIDEEEYRGLFLLNRVTYDAGPGLKRTDVFAAAGLTVEKSFTSSMSEDRDHGYYGIWMGKVYVNDSVLIPVPHYFTYKTSMGEKSVPFGWEYRRRFFNAPVPKTTYHWRAQPDTGATFNFDVVVNMPDNLVVVSPAGGTDIPRDKDLVMRWTGGGDMQILISTIDMKGVLRPVMKLHPDENTGAAILGSRIMQLLPRDQNFVFTFILANRKEDVPIDGYSEKVLVQAACIYNSYVRLR